MKMERIGDFKCEGFGCYRLLEREQAGAGRGCNQRNVNAGWLSVPKTTGVIAY